MFAVNRAPIPSAVDPSRTYIERYPSLLVRGYRADFMRDIRLNPPVYHLVISREDSPEILVLSQSRDFKQLVAEAKAEIRILIERMKSDTKLKENLLSSNLLGIVGRRTSVEVHPASKVLQRKRK